MKATFEIKEGPFGPTVDSLKNYVCPDWFRDAKFGIWSHWGPQSVPMYGDWYARHMYTEGHAQYYYHWRKYGHPSKFGYKDIIELWKAENFDPAGLMNLYVESGARYFVGQAMHHDNFDNFNSAHNSWNSVKVGPKKDICGLWQAEVKKHGLPFGLSEHLAASYTWMSASHGRDKTGPYSGIPYDGADPANRSLYRDNDSELLVIGEDNHWLTKNPKYRADWFNRIKDVIDKFQPDLLYSDSECPFGDVGLSIVAHLYNTSAAAHAGRNNAVYNFKTLTLKTKRKISPASVCWILNAVCPPGLSPVPWQDDTSLGDWFYNVRDVYKAADEVADTLVDIVAKNGNLLLNVPQKPDGKLDEETLFTLKRIGAWLKDNDEGIYGSRPNAKYREGKTELEGGPFKEKKTVWQHTDYRFTRKSNAVYAFMMRPGNEAKAVIHSLGRLNEKEIKSVDVSGRRAEFEQKDGALLVALPAGLDKNMPVCIKAAI